MNSAAEQDKTQHSISPFAIGMIVISVVAGIGVIGVTFLLIRRMRQRNKENTTTDTERNNNTSIMKQVFSTNKHHQSDIPVTSSLDNSDVFYTILEYPPTVQMSTTTSTSLKCNNNSRLLYSSSSYPEKKIDPISMSLARQSLEERAGYYRSPTRTPVPYYSSSSTSEPLTAKNTFKATENDDQDDDMKTMQRWSTCSYQVW
jgi:hypothetical protein